MGSASVTAPSPEPIKAFLSQLCQGETFRSWEIWRQPQTFLAVQQGPFWLFSGHPGHYFCTKNHRTQKKGHEQGRCGHKSSLGLWLAAKSGAKAGIWESLGGCQGKLTGHREVFAGGEGAVGTLGKEVTPSYPQTRQNYTGLTFLVLSACGCLDCSG